MVFGAEGHGLRQRTKNTVDELVSIPSVGDFGSLNVSNAVAVSLYATRTSYHTFKIQIEIYGFPFSIS